MSVATLRAKYRALAPALTERTRRIWAATEARRRGDRPLAGDDSPRNPAGVAVTDAQMATVQLARHRFHGDWNYTIRPAPSPG